METVDYIKTVFSNKKDKLLKQYRIKELALVDSSSESDELENDLNMMVEFSASADMFEVCALEYHLTALFGKKVDLYTKDSERNSLNSNSTRNLVYIQ
jgi:predicted nucleotidyltransferase